MILVQELKSPACAGCTLQTSIPTCPPLLFLIFIPLEPPAERINKYSAILGSDVAREGLNPAFLGYDPALFCRI